MNKTILCGLSFLLGGLIVFVTLNLLDTDTLDNATDNTNISLVDSISENTLTVGELYDACTRPDQAWISFCDGYIQAIYDALHQGASGNLPAICADSGVTRTQLGDIFINEPPGAQEQSRHAASYVYSLFVDAFPCSE